MRHALGLAILCLSTLSLSGQTPKVIENALGEVAGKDSIAVVGGPSSRGEQHVPLMSEDFKGHGRVVLSVCVDANGKVISAEYIPAKSTTTNKELIDAAIKNARNWTFSRAEVERQCGTITYNFQPQ